MEQPRREGAHPLQEVQYDKRSFDVSALECPRCGGTLRFIATITEESAITKILDSLGLASSPPLRRARAPDPQLDFDPVLSVA
jgi:hypothetical protein